VAKRLSLLLVCCGLLQGQGIIGISGSSGGGGGGGDTADITTGLLNDWNFETSLTADDGSEGTSITWTNTPTLRTDGCAVGSQCVELNGSTQHGAAAITFPTSGDFTFALWTYFDTVGGADIMLVGHNGASTIGEIALYITGTLAAAVWFNGIANDNIIMSNSVAITATWIHYAVTRDNGVLRLFYNGIEVGTNIGADTMDFGACELLIGTEADSGCAASLGNYLDGRLDEIRRYDRALSGTDMLALVALGP
jgi:hypothetical protein